MAVKEREEEEERGKEGRRGNVGGGRTIRWRRESRMGEGERD